MLATKNIQPQLLEILNHFAKNCFIKVNQRKNVVQWFVYGPLGELLLENIRNEWLWANVVNREKNVFPFHSNFSNDFISNIKEGFIAAKHLNKGELPFGIVNTRKVLTDNVNNSDALFPKSYTGLHYVGFLKPKEAHQYFYRWTQQRKRWWRKLSSEPGRFTFSEPKKEEGSSKEQAKVLATFPWGTHEVETLRYLGPDPFQKLNATNQNTFSVYNNEKRCYPHVVESICSLDYATLTYMCDAYTVNNKSDVVCRFHRKLAPYKFAFAASPLEAQYASDLLDMSHMICLDFRKVGLNSLMPVQTEFGKSSLQEQLAKFNSLGIPYTAVLTEKTLKTGIFGLYSRETTLQEEVHIARIQDYATLLMKNY